ncbi:MAG TPA: hypothetical protein PLU73_02730 [Bacteroidia bacterium]|nr:hypothetical protein [Bacteroidia bacterium]
MNSHFQNWLNKELHLKKTEFYLDKADKDLIEMKLLKKGESITRIVSLPRLAKLREALFVCYDHKEKKKTIIYNFDLCISLYMHYVLVHESIFHSFENWLKENNIKDTRKVSLRDQYYKEKVNYYKNKIKE